jgi:hypothetical protein
LGVRAGATKSRRKWRVDHAQRSLSYEVKTVHLPQGMALYTQCTPKTAARGTIHYSIGSCASMVAGKRSVTLRNQQCPFPQKYKRKRKFLKKSTKIIGFSPAVPAVRPAAHHRTKFSSPAGPPSTAQPHLKRKMPKPVAFQHKVGILNGSYGPM